MNISIFGGCWCSEDYYKEVYDFTKAKLNNKDYHIITGGTIGIMEAVAKGAFENHIEVTGVLLKKYEEYICDFNTNNIILNDELERVKYVMDNSDVFIVLDGDIGTYEEFFIVLKYADDINKKIYILGEKMKQALDYLFDNNILYPDSKDKLIYSTFEDFNLEIKN